MNAEHKTLKEDLLLKQESHPEKLEKIYATLKTPEIAQGLTKEDLRRI